MTTFRELEQRNPQWRPWLAVVGQVLAELDDPAWDAAVPPLAPPAEGVPLLASSSLDVAQVARLQEKLAKGVDARAVAALLPLPLLHACRRRWADAIPQAWSHGYCPVCGAWPAFAELCGVERSRYLRCGRCGSAWRAHGLSCPYCANADHEALAALVAEQGSSPWAIEVCKRCLGYLKTFTTLRLGAPAQGLIDDLASVELDIAARQRGYVRPDGPGYTLA